MYRSHVLVCGGTGCTSSGSLQIMETLKRTRHLKSWKQHSRNKLIILWIRCFLHAKK